MKKVLLALLIVLLPLSAMAAMTSVSDNELSDVTGQVGISIAIEDFTMDIYIENLYWGDTDAGSIATAKLISAKSVDYTAGYIALHDMFIPVYVTMNGTPVWKTTAANITSGLVAQTLGGADTGYTYIAAEPVKIDVSTSAVDATSTARHENPYWASQGKTAISITMPDAYITLGSFRLNGIYLVSSADDVTTTFLQAGEKYLYTSGTSQFKSGNNLGSFYLDGLSIYTYSSVPVSTIVTGLSAVTTNLMKRDTYRSAWKTFSASGAPERWYPGHEAKVIIMAHDRDGD